MKNQFTKIPMDDLPIAIIHVKRFGRDSKDKVYVEIEIEGEVVPSRRLYEGEILSLYAKVT